MSDPELFVVRVWHRLVGGFRASVRRVDDEQTHHFSRPEEVVRFLASATPPDEPSDPVDPTAAPNTKP